MQTLLSALKDLKCDMVKDSQIKKENQFNLYKCKISELVSKVLQIAETKSNLTKDFIVPINKQFDDLKLKDDFLALMAPDSAAAVCQDPKLWLEMLEKELGHSRKKYYSLLENKKSYITKEIDFKTSIDEVEKAVHSSEALRHRLINLAQGPLSCLFEDPNVSNIKNCAPKEEEVLKNNCEGLKHEKQLNDLHQRIKELSLFIIRVRSTLHKLESQKFIDTSNISFEAMESIKELRKSVVEPNEVIVNESSLHKADKKIQAEISMLLATLTVDRQSLDTVLRSIKSDCDVLKNKFEFEMAAEMYKILKHIQATYVSANQIFLNSF